MAWLIAFLLMLLCFAAIVWGALAGRKPACGACGGVAYTRTEEGAKVRESAP